MCSRRWRALAGINGRAGYMFQSEALMPWRSCLDNVTAGLEFRGVAREEARKKAKSRQARETASGGEAGEMGAIGTEGFMKGILDQIPDLGDPVPVVLVVAHAAPFLSPSRTSLALTR